MIRIFKFFKTFTLLFILFSTVNAFGDEASSGINPEDYESELFENSESLTNIQLHENLIKAAEVRQATGDLSGAAELFKKASLAVRGEKDFLSLYRSAVLNVEMAYFREAEADLRAILMFSDVPELRIKASLLTARLKSLQNNIDEAQSILIDIFQSDEIPEEAAIWAVDFYEKNKDTFDMTELELLLTNSKDKTFSAASELKSIITPEMFFGSSKICEVIDIEDEPENTEIQSVEEEAEVSTAIQLGSFTKKENAEDLLKSINNTGNPAVIKTKEVGGKIYYAVIVPVRESQDIQNLIIELKEKGYEGYPVY